MTARSLRFCCVSDQAKEVAEVFDALGLPRRPMDDCGSASSGGFQGAIFEAGDAWIEIWQASAGMPAGTMLQLVVDDSASTAERASAAGLSPQGPMEAHGESIYFLAAPGGLQLSFQSPSKDS